MVSESGSGWWVSEDAGSPRGVDCEVVGEGNEAFLIRAWKPLTSKQNLKPWAKADNI